MKLIDDKGRFLGRFNILDIFIFIIIAVSSVSLYMAIVHKDKLKNVLMGEDEIWYATVEIILDKDDFWLRRYINVGDIEKDGYGRTSWQVLDLREIADSNLEKRVLVKTRLMVYKERTGAIRYGRYGIVIGEGIALSGARYVLRGSIYSFAQLEERVPF